MNEHTSSKSGKKIFIFGYYGWYNVGDDAIGYAIIRQLSKKYLNPIITMTIKDEYFLSKNQVDNKIQRIPFNLVSILKAINKTDEFIIAGGTHFQDEDKSLFLKLKVFLFFSFVVKYANIINRPPILFGHGIGPIRHFWTKFLVKKIFKNSKIILVRDEDSFNFVTLLGFKKKCFLGFDVTASLFAGPQSPIYKKDKILGISILPYHTIYEYCPLKDDQIIANFESCIRQVFSFDKELKVAFFSFRSGKIDSDEEILLKISNNLDEYHDRINMITYSGDICQFLLEINTCDYFIGMRYHSSLFAYLSKKPLILIDYQQKCQNLAKEIVLPKKSIIELDDLKSNILYNKIEDILLNPNEFISPIPIEEMINKVNTMYEYL